MAAKLDPKQRAAQKDAARAMDAKAIADGTASAQDIQRRNAIFAKPGMKISFDARVRHRRGATKTA